jgi:CheY-like chemotaxis protein
MSLILALENDAERARTLQRLVGAWTDAEVVVAPSADEAIAFMHRHDPDLILVSSLARPGDDRTLTEFLRRMPDSLQIPSLTVPPLIDPGDAALREDDRRGLRSIFGLGRKSRLWQAYDPHALTSRLRHALEVSCSLAHARDTNRRLMPAVSASHDPFLDALLRDFARAHGERSEPGRDGALDRGDSAAMRARARRWSNEDLSWLTEVKLPWGLRVDLLNISSSGVLVESAARFVEGSTTVFRLNGSDQHLLIPATVVRSEVANANARGVTYRAAATFDQIMMEAELLRPATAATPIRMRAPDPAEAPDRGQRQWQLVPAGSC